MDIDAHLKENYFPYCPFKLNLSMIGPGFFSIYESHAVLRATDRTTHQISHKNSWGVFYTWAPFKKKWAQKWPQRERKEFYLRSKLCCTFYSIEELCSSVCGPWMSYTMDQG
jgi:hypothetical protein